MKSEKQEKFGSKIKTLSVTLLKYFQSNISVCHNDSELTKLGQWCDGHCKWQFAFIYSLKLSNFNCCWYQSWEICDHSRDQSKVKVISLKSIMPLIECLCWVEKENRSVKKCLIW